METPKARVMGLASLLLFILAALMSGSVAAWKLPERFKSFGILDRSPQTLDYMIVTLNGHAMIVKNKQELAFVRGDILIIKEVVLKSPRFHPKKVTMIGLQGPDAAGDDIRNLPIDTAVSLVDKGAAVNPAGDTYAAIVSTKRSVNGWIGLRRIEPRLSYIDVLINGKAKVVREGEPLVVHAKDDFKVVRVVSNVEKQDEIRFQITQESEDASIKHFNIFVTNKNYVFAKVPLIVETL